MDAATCPEIDHSIFSFLAAGVAVVWCFMRFLYFRTQPGGVYDTPLLLKQGWLWYSSRVLGSTPSSWTYSHDPMLTSLSSLTSTSELGSLFSSSFPSLPSSFLQKSRLFRLFLFPSRYIQTLLSTSFSSIFSCSSPYLHSLSSASPWSHPHFHCPSLMGNNICLEHSMYCYS